MTYKLEYAYMVDAIFFVGAFGEKLIGPFHVYVGFNDDYTLNEECNNGPYLVSATANPSPWPNGAEVWCGIQGNYVTIWRDRAVPDIE